MVDVLVTVLLAVLVAIDERDVAAALVEVANVVAVESIAIPDMPDIVPMSMPDISIFGFLWGFEMNGRLSSGYWSSDLEAVTQHDGRVHC